MSRIPLLTEDDLPEKCDLSLTHPILGEMNLLRARANNSSLLRAAKEYVSAIKNHAGLSLRELELAILSVARTLESTYEWHQHLDLAPTRDVTKSEVRAISRGDLSGFAADERALIEYAAAVSQRDVDDKTYDALAAQYDDRTILGATILAAHYVETAYVLDALDVPLEEAFTGWEPS